MAGRRHAAAYGLGHRVLLLMADIAPVQAQHLISRLDGMKQWLPGRCLFAAEYGGAAENGTEVCIGMSPVFNKETAAYLPKANITFDKFHAVKIVNDAVDQVRRAEQKNRPERKRAISG